MNVHRLFALVVVSSFLVGCGAARLRNPTLLPAMQAAAAAGPQSSAEKDKLVVEAWTTLAVEDIEKAAEKIRDLVRNFAGKILEDNIQAFHARGSLTLRTPPDRVDELLERLGGFGKLHQRHVKRTDVTKEFVDNEITLGNLTKALDRYREILKKAQSVEEVLLVEKEMTRIRGEIEHTKGTLAYLNDRVKLATVHVTLEAEVPAVFAANAKFHPGVRVSSVRLFTENNTPRRFAGPGLSIHVNRGMQLDLDVMQGEDGDVDLILATIGGDAYSDFLGRGKRRWVNPYIGLRIGTARITDQFKFLVIGTGGVEIFKTDHVLVDSQVRLITTTDENSNLTLGVQPTVSVHLAF